MKTKKLILALSLGLMIPVMSMGQSTLGPGTLGSQSSLGNPHNFSGYAWNPYNSATKQGGQICQPCHTPHNSNITAAAPLWNHEITSAAFTVYESENTTTEAINGGFPVPDGTSLLCLSCHDGSVALASFGSQVGTDKLTGGANLTEDLRNDHPVSIVYDNYASASVGFLRGSTYLYATSFDATAGTYAAGTKTIATGLLDKNGKMQCTSCHYGHGNSNGYILKMNNRGSLLCLACHNK